MLQKLKKQSSGFTIIEVMIVLAIAGLILLIVFLAVPALQRNAHNTSAKNDVSGILGAMNEYVNNNNGVVPTGNVFSGSGNTLTVKGGTGTNPATANLGYYDPATVKKVNGANFPAAGAGVNVEFGVTCNSTGTGTIAGTARNYVALFTLEGGAKECTSS